MKELCADDHLFIDYRDAGRETRDIPIDISGLTGTEDRVFTVFVLTSVDIRETRTAS
jgi:hypothetical protein